MRKTILFVAFLFLLIFSFGCSRDTQETEQTNTELIRANEGLQRNIEELKRTNEELTAELEKIKCILSNYENLTMNFMEPESKKRFAGKEQPLLLLPIVDSPAISTIMQNSVIGVENRAMVGNEEWLYVTIPVYCSPANNHGWIKKGDTQPYTLELQQYVLGDVFIDEGTYIYKTYEMDKLALLEPVRLSYTLRGRIHRKEDGYAVISAAGGMTIIVKEEDIRYPAPD